MSVFFLIIVLVLFLGPLRRPFLRNARFTIPATVGFFTGFGIIIMAARASGVLRGEVVLLGLLAAIVFACLFGEELKKLCDRVFGPKQQRRD